MLQAESDLTNKIYLQWLQLIDAIPNSWKDII